MQLTVAQYGLLMELRGRDTVCVQYHVGTGARGGRIRRGEKRWHAAEQLIALGLAEAVGGPLREVHPEGRGNATRTYSRVLRLTAKAQAETDLRTYFAAPPCNAP